MGVISWLVEVLLLAGADVQMFRGKMQPAMLLLVAGSVAGPVGSSIFH